MNVAHLLIGQAQARPDAIAIVEGSGSRRRAITFAELDARSAQGAALLTDAGITPGDAVLVFVPMSVELYVALIAIFRVGAVATFLDPSAGRAHIGRCGAMLPPAAMIAVTRAHLLRLTTPAIRRIRTKFTVGWPVPGATRWEKAATLSTRREIVDRADDDAALVTFTSGSTGQPKAAVRSHGFLAAQHAALAHAIDLQPGQTDLATLPIFSLANLASGVTSVIPDADLRRPARVDAGPILRQMIEHRVTRTVASPAFLERLLAAPGAADAMRALRRIDTGGAPVFPRLLERLQRAAPDADVIALYGSTEAEPIAHLAWREMTPDDVAAMLAGRGLLAGPAVAEIDLRIVDATWGEPLPAMNADAFAARTLGPVVPGEIVVAGRHVLPGYLHGSGDQETKFRVDGRVWHRTGDAGYLDARGRLWLLGRAQARIVDASGTLYPFAVEAAVSQIEGVCRSALVALDGRRTLFVEPTPDAPVTLRDDVAAKVRWAALHEVRLIDQIPVDARHNAKVDYPALMRRVRP